MDEKDNSSFKRWKREKIIENNQKEFNHEGDSQKKMDLFVEFQIYRPIEVYEKFNINKRK